MAKQYPKNARAEAARGYPPTPDADLFQGEKPGVEGWGARERSQKMNNAQLRSLQAMIEAGIDPDHAYLVIIGQQSLTTAEHNQVANYGKNPKAPPSGSSPADLDPLDGAPAGEMPVDKRVDDNFDPQTGAPIKPRQAGRPPAPSEEETFEPTSKAYKGYEQFGARNWGSQDKRSSDEKADGRERVQRTGGGYANADELGALNNPDGYTPEERRLNARVLSPKQQEEKRRAEQDDAAKLRHEQMKPRYDSRNGDLLQDQRLERNGWRPTKGPDGRMRYTATDQFDDGSSNGVRSQARIDAHNGVVRDPNGNVLRSPGPGGGAPVYGPDRFRGNQRPDVRPNPNVQPQGGGGQMAVPPEDLQGVPRFMQAPKDDQPEVLSRMDQVLQSQAKLFPHMVAMERAAGRSGIGAIDKYERAVKARTGEFPSNWQYVGALSEPGGMDQIPSLYPEQGSPQSPPIKTMPYVKGQQQGNPDAPLIQTLPARRDVGQGKPQPAPIALMQQSMQQSRDRRDIEMPIPPSVGGPVRNSLPVKQGQPMEGGGGPVEGDGYGPLAGGRQLSEGLDGGTHFQRQQRMQRMAARRRVPVETIAQEIEAAEAAGAASGEFGYNSGRAWEKTISRDQSVRNADASERADRFKNKAMYGPAGQAMNLVNDAQFSNDPSQAGQWHNFMLAQAMLGPQQPIVDPNAVTAQQGTQAFALASRLAGNAAFGGDAAGAAARNDARTDKAHDDFYKQDHSRAWHEGPDTPEERSILIEDKFLQSQGKVSREAIAAHLNQKRGAVQLPGTPPGPAPTDTAAGGSFQ